MNLLFFGDLHLADKPPAGRVDDYAQTILDKIAAIAHLCREHQVQYALGAGDIFHVKQPSRVSHALVQRAIEVFKAFPCPVLVVPGNHDLGPDGLQSLPRQPLGTLEKAGTIRILREINLFCEEGTLEPKFWLVPRPYNANAEGAQDGETDPSYYSLTPEEKERITADPRPVIGLAHASILGPGDSRPYPCVNFEKIPEFWLYDLFVSGHLHECLGVIPVEAVVEPHKSGDPLNMTIFANPGSIARTQRNLSNYSRTVEVLIATVTKDGLKVQEVPLPGVLPALEVFGKREPVDSPDAPSDEIAKFVQTLGEGLRADTLSIPELLAEFDIEPEVKAEVQRLLEEAES